MSTYFEANEIAYLGLTSKLELPLRDKLAFRLQQILGDSYIVAREWSEKSGGTKADIAILTDQGELKCLVEIKAYTAMKGIQEMGKHMLSDVEKSKEVIGTKDVENVFILFANRIERLPKSKIVQENTLKKYSIKIGKAIDEGIKDSDIITKWQNSIPKKIKIQEERILKFEGGSQFGIDLDVIGFVYLVS